MEEITIINSTHEFIELSNGNKYTRAIDNDSDGTCNCNSCDMIECNLNKSILATGYITYSNHQYCTVNGDEYILVKYNPCTVSTNEDTMRNSTKQANTTTTTNQDNFQVGDTVYSLLWEGPAIVESNDNSSIYVLTACGHTFTASGRLVSNECNLKTDLSHTPLSVTGHTTTKFRNRFKPHTKFLETSSNRIFTLVNETIDLISIRAGDLTIKLTLDNLRDKFETLETRPI